jgi:DNA-directed RNA polymerase subunit RPC12/RpoP
MEDDVHNKFYSGYADGEDGENNPICPHCGFLIKAICSSNGMIYECSVCGRQYDTVKEGIVQWH